MTEAETKAYLNARMLANGTDSSDWEAASPMRTLLAILAWIFAGFSALIAALAKMMFISSAEDSWLDVNGEGHWDQTRGKATYAGGTLTVGNTGGISHNIPKGGLVITNGRTGKQYRNDVLFTSSPGSSLPIPVTAIEKGSASSAIAGEVSIVTSVYLGLNCTNASPFLAVDDQTNEEYRETLAEFPNLYSSADPRGIYRKTLRAGKNYADGALLGINRVQPRPNGSYIAMPIYVATTSGALLSGTSTDISTQLGAATDIANSVCPFGMSVEVKNAAPVDYTLYYNVWVNGVMPLDFEALVNLKVATILSEVPIGGYILDGSGTGELPSAPLNDAPLTVAKALGLSSVIKVTTGILPGLAANEYPRLSPSAIKPVIINLVPVR